MSAAAISSASAASSSSSTLITADEATRSAAWGGCIPVVVTLAPTSLSSPTLPPPVHALLSRQTYLHVGLNSAVHRLRKFAFTGFSLSSRGGAGGGFLAQTEPDPGSYDSNDSPDSKKDRTAEGNDCGGDGRTRTRSSSCQSPPGDAGCPVCWFEDEVTQTALRWHVFAGVLFDLKRDRDLPWRIRLHFNSYPNSQILPLDSNGSSGSGGAVDVLEQVRFAYKNSLKQALCLQYGNSKTAMSVTRESHGRLWESLGGSSSTSTDPGDCGRLGGGCGATVANYRLYQQGNDGLQLLDGERLSLIPVRLYINARPPIQKRCRAAAPPSSDSGGDGDGTSSSAVPLTLGQLLADWDPAHFKVVRRTNDSSNKNRTASSSTSETVRPAREVVACRVAGIDAPLDAPLLDLWANLCHPDHFLNVSVVSN